MDAPTAAVDVAKVVFEVAIADRHWHIVGRLSSCAANPSSVAVDRIAGGGVILSIPTATIRLGDGWDLQEGWPRDRMSGIADGQGVRPLCGLSRFRFPGGEVPQLVGVASPDQRAPRRLSREIGLDRFRPAFLLFGSRPARVGRHLRLLPGCLLERRQERGQFGSEVADQLARQCHRRAVGGNQPAAVDGWRNQSIDHRREIAQGALPGVGLGGEIGHRGFAPV